MAKFLLRESFDTYTGPNAPVGVRSRWNVVNNDDQNNWLQPGRFLGRSCGIGGTDGFRRPLDEDTDELTVGFSYKASMLPVRLNSGTFVALCTTSLNWQVGLGCTPDGRITAQRQNSADSRDALLGESEPGILQPNVWNFIELEFKNHDTEGFMRVYMNGDPVPVINVENVDTRRLNEKIRWLNLGCTPYFTELGRSLYDDVYVWDEPLRRGPIRIESLPIDGNGAHQDFTPSEGTSNAACVDDETPNITDYVIGTAPGQYDEYTIRNLSSNAADVFEVNLVMLGQQTGSTIRAMTLGIESEGVVSKGEDIYMGSGFARYERRMLTDPRGDQWTKETVDSLILRPEITV